MSGKYGDMLWIARTHAQTNKTIFTADTLTYEITPLTPNDTYRGRTAPLTSKVTFYVFIQQI